MKSTNTEQSTASTASSAHATRRGKIARLTDDIRQQINQRLLDGQEGLAILDWLNALPEVRTLVDSQFQGVPVSPANLTEWKQGGYRDWLVARNASALVAGLRDPGLLGQPGLSSDFTTILAHCIALHYASCAQSLLSPDAQPRDLLDLLHNLTADVTRLRRSDTVARRLALDREWLALENEKSNRATEAKFWKWTKRPEIRKKLFPKRRRGLTTKTLRKIERKFNLFPEDLPEPDSPDMNLP